MLESEVLELVFERIVKVIDPTTGECFFSQDDYKNSLKRLPKHRPAGYVGIDTKWLSQCKDSKDLLFTLKQIDPYLLPKTKVLVDNAYLLDCVASGLLSAKNVGSLLKLSRYCVGWNIGFASKGELVGASGVSVKNFSRWCDELSTYVGFERLYPCSDEYRLIFNPLVAWKGCKVIRDAKISQYYGLSSKIEE